MAYYAMQKGRRLPGGTAGVTLAVGDLVYLDSSGQWQKADADVKGKYPAQGVVTEAASANEAVEVCDAAVIGGGSGLTAGATLFLSKTPGAPTESAPSSAFDCIQAVGYNKSATVMVIDVAPQRYLKPS